jgi:NAD(P)-dependent dehydrogenase (short-subunit alcohol dehydrogenase family)
LCEAGANVAITYSSTPPAEADNIAAIIAAANNSRTVVAYKCDVKSKTEVQATVEKATAELGAVKLDIVVANAGTISSVTYLMSTSMGHAGRRKQRPRFSKDSRKKKNSASRIDHLYRIGISDSCECASRRRLRIIPVNLLWSIYPSLFP